jgi:hypothetical protein
VQAFLISPRGHYENLILRHFLRLRQHKNSLKSRNDKLNYDEKRAKNVVSKE